MASCQEALKLNCSGGTPLLSRLAICSARLPEDNHGFTNTGELQIVSYKGKIIYSTSQLLTNWNYSPDFMQWLCCDDIQF